MTSTADVLDDSQVRVHMSVAPPGRRGEATPPWVDVQNLCDICVLSLSWNFFVSHDKYIARPSSKEPRWYIDNTTGTAGLRTLDPYRPIPHFPPVTKSWRRHFMSYSKDEKLQIDCLLAIYHTVNRVAVRRHLQWLTKLTKYRIERWRTVERKG